MQQENHSKCYRLSLYSIRNCRNFLKSKSNWHAQLESQCKGDHISPLTLALKIDGWVGPCVWSVGVHVRVVGVRVGSAGLFRHQDVGKDNANWSHWWSRPMGGSNDNVLHSGGVLANQAKWKLIKN